MYLAIYSRKEMKITERRMTKSIGVGQAHSKIILIGEHAVVYGYPAIALPLLHIQVTCQIVPAERPWVLLRMTAYRWRSTLP